MNIIWRSARAIPIFDITRRIGTVTLFAPLTDHRQAANIIENVSSGPRTGLWNLNYEL